MSQKHISILKPRYLELILKGQKTIESRFLATRSLPWDKVFEGDKIFFKANNTRFASVSAVVGRIDQNEFKNPQEYWHFIDKYRTQILADQEYYKEKENSKYGIVLFLKDVKEIKPFEVERSYGSGWKVL